MSGTGIETSSMRTPLLLAGVGGLLGGLLVGGVGMYLVTDSPESVVVEAEFSTTVTAVNDRSVCGVVDGDPSCGIPVYADPRDPAQVGDEIEVTVLQLGDGRGGSYEAWYVRP